MATPDTSPAPDLWRLLPFAHAPADWQLAGGTAMLAGLEQQPQPALRWYTMHAPALVLGTGQPLDQVDQAALHAAGARLYRRKSGGTAVHTHDLLLMQDIVLPTRHPLATADVTVSYRWLGAVWVAALARLGVAARLIEVDEARSDRRGLDTLTRRSCYGGRSPYEVLADERKLVGLAQVRRRAGALLQAGIYIMWQSDELVRLLALAPAERTTLRRTLDQRVVGLAELLPAADPPALLPAVQAAFATALHEHHGARLQPADWNAAEVEHRAAAVAGYALPLQ